MKHEYLPDVGADVNTAIGSVAWSTLATHGVAGLSKDSALSLVIR